MRAVLVLLVACSFVPAVYGQSYMLTAEEHVYEIPYTVDATVIAMAIDKETNSLLVGLENTQDSILEIHLPDEMISAENNEFVVLVDWIEADYMLVHTGITNMTVMQIPVADDSLEVEIIGTHVIPEFPAVMMILAVIMTITLVSGILGRNRI